MLWLNLVFGYFIILWIVAKWEYKTLTIEDSHLTLSKEEEIKFDDMNRELALFFGFFWPVTVPKLLITKLGRYIKSKL